MCGEPTTDITLSIIDFNLKSKNYDIIKLLIQNMNLTQSNHQPPRPPNEKIIIWSQYFSMWKIFDIVETEVTRNIIIALVCVMLCTVLLIMEWQMSFWIFVCVVLTTINIVGFMYHIGLKIDMITSFTMQVGVGLCIDYIVHIGHTFLTTIDGSRHERALASVKSIGPAVFFGGSSTLMALIMLSVSDSYIMQSFFKVCCFVLYI